MRKTLHYGKSAHAHGLSKINIKFSKICFTKSDLWTKAVSIKLPIAFMTELEKKKLLKFTYRIQKTASIRAILSRKSCSGVSQYKLSYRAILTKPTCRYWHRIIHGDQVNRIVCQEANPSSYSHLLFEKVVLNTY